MMLTIAVSADPSKMDDVEWSNVSGLVDKINLMSYDFFGAFDSFTNHNSPLFAPAQGNPAFNAHTAIETLVNTYQFGIGLLRAFANYSLFTEFVSIKYWSGRSADFSGR